MLAETGAHYYSGHNFELNTACRSHYKVAVTDAGNSDILRGISEQTRER
ncbi:60S ribosomal protein L30 [Lemmus lemmus]